MSALTWDGTGERFYETGVDRGVLFPVSNGAYGAGVAWNGLTAVNESPDGGEPTDLYADNIKYLSLMSNENFKFTIEAYTYPDEFAICDGSKPLEATSGQTTTPVAGVYATSQTRKTFGFSYRTKIGNDVDFDDKGYKIHLCYGCLAAPSEKSHATINDSPDAATFSWSVTTTPVEIGTGFKPTAHIVIDSTKVDATKLSNFEKTLYGDTNDPTLPLPAAVVAAFA